MRNKTKNQSVFFRGAIVTLALALTILCFPFNIVALVKAETTSVDYSHMTIAAVGEESVTTVTKGGTYRIRKALIGGNEKCVVGAIDESSVPAGMEFAHNSETVVLKSSKVTVKYSSAVVGEVKEGTASGSVSISSDPSYFAEFEANKIGTYTITYSYEYELTDGTTRSNEYSINVTSEITDASINVVSNSEKFLPSIIDLSVEKDKNIDLYIPKPEIVGEDGKVVKESDYLLTKTKSEAISDKENNYVVVSVASSSGSNVTLEYNNDLKLYYVAGSTFTSTDFGAGKYTVTYSYYEKGNFITSTTKSVQVYAKDDPYYKDYKLAFDLASDWKDDGETGVEKVLPAVKGLTASTTTPENENVDVYYTVKVYYKENSGDDYKVINATEYNEKAGETVINNDGTLVDASKFKPLKDGNYSFVYTVYDIYGHSVSTTIGLYQYTDVEDETAPTPVVYDASTYVESEGYIDASSKLAYYSNPAEVVVYAIGINDAVSKATDEGVILERKIMEDSSSTLLSVKDYNDKNLVFNYNNAESLRVNNYIIRKQTADGITDAEMLTWLNGHGYMIVVDNANYSHIYTTFASVIGDKCTQEAAALEWFKTSKEAKEMGFAYVNADKTFGSASGATSSTTKGAGTGLYYVHYIATEVAKNATEKDRITDISKNMYIASHQDNEAPTLKITTNLLDKYLKGSEISFEVSEPSDTRDTRLENKVFYRLLNGETVVGEDNVDLTDVYKDNDNETSKYAGKGYVELSKDDSSAYKIEVPKDTTATKLQIVAYAYDDFGNVGVCNQEVSISNVKDTKAPKLGTATTNATNLVQGAEIELPTISYIDDAVEYLTYDVAVRYVDNDSNITDIPSYDDRKEVNVTNTNGFGQYTVYAGKFVAPYEGRYEVTVSVKDFSGNTIAVFESYDVEGREIFNAPEISSTLSSQTVELDDNPVIEIPVPTINYKLPNSITFDTYKANGAGDAKYVIRGIDADGKPTAYYTNGKETIETFIPTAEGTYEIKYTSNIEIFNPDKFEYVEGNPETYELGGYYKLKADESVHIYIERENLDIVKYVVSDLTITKNEDNQVVVSDGINSYVYNADEDKYYDGDTEVSKDSIFINATLRDINFEDWFNKELKAYTLSSANYTITVNDNKGPKVKDSTFDYSEQKTMSVDDFKANGIKIFGIEAEDASGIDVEKSQIVISWKRANGTTSGNTGSYTIGKNTTSSKDKFKDAFVDTTLTKDDLSAGKYDGLYTITYTIYDKKGNYTSKEFDVAVGDNEPPRLTFKEDFVESSYELGKGYVDVDLAKINFSDNKSMPDDAAPVIKLVNTSTNKEIKYTVVDNHYIFEKFEEVGTYELTVEIEDSVGHVTSKSFTIDVTKKTTNSVKVYQVVGIILIVVSVLVLAGVIVYFIISKVKLDKELKK